MSKFNQDIEGVISDLDYLKTLQELMIQETGVNVRKKKGSNYREGLRMFIALAALLKTPKRYYYPNGQLKKFVIGKISPEMIAAFLRKDRTTIIYHQKTHNNLLEVDQAYRQKFTMIKNSFYEN